MTVSANYTWSHCITELWQEAATNPTSNQGWGDPDNRRYDRGNCSTAATDRRHLFNLSGVAETPSFTNAKLRALASGWRLSPIFKLLSGGYLSVSTSTDVALNGMSAQHVSQVLGDPYGDKSPGNYLNPKAFALPDAVRLEIRASEPLLDPARGSSTSRCRERSSSMKVKRWSFARKRSTLRTVFD